MADRPVRDLEGDGGQVLRSFSRSLPMNLMLAREAVMRGFRRILAEHDLNEQQWRVIRLLNEQESVEAGALADMVFLLGPSLTRILHRLEARDLIERRPAEDDRRKVNVSITAAGRRLFAQVAPSSRAEYQRLERELGREALDSLVDTLKLITAKLNQLDDAE